MGALREKVTVSLYYDELVAIEKLKKRLSSDGLLVAPTTSEIVRLALHVLGKASRRELEAAVTVTPDRRAGRPKGLIKHTI
ncbi:hypothetical protein IQ278_12025 [Tolypothrix sp. LEGE 11397]|uniref:hypothetical protein n=1 Tax=Tolypothrix sp. LEGE 11397 TaxID=2777971 RepID=UPI00187E1487|nr:hypothetical protein [Tolypothrix sp. LEGE 11397]MBE9082841.1 hypothetical protein [Tolypothrix sp. LEGE 11397]